MKKKSTHIILLLLAFAASTIGYAQINTVGAVTQFKKITGGIQAQTANAIIEVKAWNENTIRVNVSKNKNFRNFSYALVSNTTPVFSAVTVTEKDNAILLQTKYVHAVITKTPLFTIKFYNENEALLNEDVTGSGMATSFIGDKITVNKTMQDGEHFIGLGEALGNIDRRGSGVTLNNTDTYKYGDARLPMYSSVPFYMGIHHQLQYGLFYNNTYKGFFNFGLSTPGRMSVSFDGGDMDYFFIYDTTISGIISQYTALTGRMMLPPKWAIGYHQSRCSYYPQEKVEWIAQTFRQKKIPLDCIVLDADYQQNYQPFRINKERFPDMPGLAAKLAAQHIELTASVYPGVKVDSTYESYTDGLKKDVFIKNADGSVFKTEIDPLACYLPDYTNPKTRTWWSDKMKWLPDNGIHGYWNDMNEPAIGGSYLPENTVFDFDGHKANALEAKNVYALQMARSSFESALKYGNGRRPFVLSRSGFAGLQRYSAIWSGDNMATDEGMLTSVLLNNQLGLSGMPFCGYDLGGYIGDATKDLYKRWIEVGVFSPFCRNHREFFGAANEPWAYGEEAEAISKTYIELRYRLMPYLYSAFYQAAQTGQPIAKNLAINYPYDENSYNINYQYQFLFGEAMLVAPVSSKEKSKPVYLPNGEWYNAFTDEKVKGGTEKNMDVPIYQLPIFIKASSIIPMQQVVQSTKDHPGDTLFIHLYNGTEKNSYTYYEDAGDGMEFEKGVFHKRDIVFDPIQQQISFSKTAGSYISAFKKIQLIFHGFNALPGSCLVNDTKVFLKHDVKKLVDPLSDLKDYYAPEYFDGFKKAEPLQNHSTLTIDQSNSMIIIKW